MRVFDAFPKLSCKVGSGGMDRLSSVVTSIPIHLQEQEGPSERFDLAEKQVQLFQVRINGGYHKDKGITRVKIFL